MAKRKGNIKSNGKENDREGKGKTGKWEGEEREGRKVMGAEIEEDRETRK